LIAYLILFDIDGTLVSSSRQERGEGRRFTQAIYDVVGKEPSVTPARYAGMVDPQICKVILVDEIGLDEEAAARLLPKVIERMGEIYRTMTPHPVLNKGVMQLLRVLGESRTHVLGVLTGNISAVASKKLTVAGVSSFFSENFYADGYMDRNRLVKDAVEVCVVKYHSLERKHIIIVGDTPLDIAAANAAKATSVGIASGTFSSSQLSSAGAKWIFPTLEPSRELLTALGLPQP
jgi:phosphoglycolate phosphatase-like HAD superfamily hydrolase